MAMTARDQVEDVAKLLRYAVAEVRDTVETSLSVGERKHVSAAIEHLRQDGLGKLRCRLTEVKTDGRNNI